MTRCQQGFRLRPIAQHVKELHTIVPYFRATLQEHLGPIFSGARVMHDLLVTFQVRAPSPTTRKSVSSGDQNELQKEWIEALDRLGKMHGVYCTIAERLSST